MEALGPRCRLWTSMLDGRCPQPLKMSTTATLKAGMRVVSQARPAITMNAVVLMTDGLAVIFKSVSLKLPRRFRSSALGAPAVRSACHRAARLLPACR